METTAAQKTHPLVLVAATAVTLVSLAGVGAIFGLIPSGQQAATPAPVAVAAPTPAVAPAPAAPTPTAAPASTTLSLPAGTAVKIETPTPAPRRTQSASRPAPRAVEAAERRPSGGDTYRVANDNSAPIYAERAEPKRAAACRDCGVIADVREITKDAEGSGVGAVAGGLLGGVLGNQVGGGRGRDAMTVIGAVGGAVAGHQIEKKQRATHEYQITVRFDDGTTQVITQPTEPAWRNGDRVRLSNGQIVAL